MASDNRGESTEGDGYPASVSDGEENYLCASDGDERFGQVGRQVRVKHHFTDSEDSALETETNRYLVVDESLSPAEDPYNDKNSYYQGLEKVVYTV